MSYSKLNTQSFKMDKWVNTKTDIILQIALIVKLKLYL